MKKEVALITGIAFFLVLVIAVAIGILIIYLFN